MLLPLALTAAAAFAPAQAVTAPLPSEASFAGDGSEQPASCFTMEPPGAGWRRLELHELREVYSEAEVGLSGPQGVNSVLCVRRDPRRDLSACVSELLGEQLLEQTRESFREATRVDGRPAAHALVSGRRGGTWWRYHATAFREGEELYLLLSWGRSDDVPADGSTLLEATLGLRRVEGVGFDELSLANSAGDAEGPGWRVRGGVYRDAALAFALAPRGAWRVATRVELADLGPHVHAGLVDELHDAVLGFVAERVPGVNQGDYAEDCRRRALTRGHSAGSRLERIVGREIEVRRFALPSPTGFADGTVRGVFAVFFEGDRCFQVLGRYPAAAEQAMVRSLPQGLASLRLLGPEEVRELAARLADDPVTTESVGAGWSLRDGVYTDYLRGLRWRLPAGYWEVDAGPDDADGPSLELYERDLGVRGWIRVDEDARFSGEEGHRRALEELTQSRVRHMPESLLRVQFGSLAGLASSCDVRLGSSTSRALLASAGDERRSLRLCLMGPPQAMESNAERVAAALAALEVSATPLTPTVMHDGVYSDARLGFRLESPRPEWGFGECKVERFGPRAAAAEGVLVSFEDGTGQGVYAAAAWSEAGPGGLQQPWATWIPTALQSAVRLPAHEPVSDESGSLNGVPCRFLTWTDGERTLELALLTRSRTAFVAAAVRVGAQDGPRTWLDGFRLAP
ncbi:MAG TPA: hypothetical protein VMT18_01025 [Planctomycetota bacterium]|nr:hypothetical protein [Planctomycetota bacterium]